MLLVGGAATLSLVKHPYVLNGADITLSVERLNLRQWNGYNLLSGVAHSF